MRILFFIDTLGAGGKERRMVELMKALKLIPNIDFEIIVMSSDIHDKEIRNLGIKIHTIIRKTKKDLSVFHKLFAISKSFKPDFVHCWDSMTAIYSVPVCKLLEIKLINGMVIDSPTNQTIFNKTWLRAKLTFPFSTLIIGNSDAGIQAYKSPRSKSAVIYNGFNFNRLNNLSSSENLRSELGINTEYVIGMVASFSVNKDYSTFYAAAKLVLSRRIDVTFIAIGNNTDSDVSRFLLGEKHQENFRLLGKKSNVESYVNIMDVCVLATFTEGISNSILEYMSLSKPVIATSGGGTNEIVVDEQTGFLVKQSDPKDLADKVEILLNDRTKRQEMGKSGRRRIEDVFSIESMVAKYVSVYSALS